jgi:hypothetical protein
MRTGQQELIRVRQIEALKAAVGTWKDEDHRELKRGAAAWVVKVHREDEKRNRRVAART